MTTKSELIEGYRENYKAANQAQIDPQGAEERLRNETEGQIGYYANKLAQIETEMANLERTKQLLSKKMADLQEKLGLLNQS